MIPREIVTRAVDTKCNKSAMRCKTPSDNDDDDGEAAPDDDEADTDVVEGEVVALVGRFRSRLNISTV